MDQTDLLNFVIAALERQRVTYAITGSQASSAYGEIRFTNDIDVVVHLNTQSHLGQLLAEFPAQDFYVSDIAARNAVASGGQFNIIHQESSQKIDLIVQRELDWPDPVARRISLPIGADRMIWFISPEDLILRKMDFYREGGSEKHLRDIAGLLKISGEKVDRTYVSGWAKRLGLTAIWNSILSGVGSAPSG